MVSKLLHVGIWKFAKLIKKVEFGDFIVWSGTSDIVLYFLHAIVFIFLGSSSGGKAASCKVLMAVLRQTRFIPCAGQPGTNVHCANTHKEYSLSMPLVHGTTDHKLGRSRANLIFYTEYASSLL